MGSWMSVWARPSAARNPPGCAHLRTLGGTPQPGAEGTLTAVEPPGYFVASHAQHWRELAWQRFVGRIPTSLS